MITPYHGDGTVDYDTIEKYVEWYYEKGCTGIFSICQSSEIFYLTLEERVKINKTVFDKVNKLHKNGGRRMTVVSSGHVSDSLQEQARELNAVAESGTDALILITNRLDLHNEGDDVWIANAEKLLSMLPKNVKLGLYECPSSYKRLVTPRILNWCLEKGRFYYMKDTCCDPDLLAERLALLEGSHFKLLNANCQTLLSYLRHGGAGYCGIMCNYHPELYVWLCENFEKEPKKADLISAVICMTGFTEVGIQYPLTAKYHMCLEGIHTENLARNATSDCLDPYAKLCMEQMRLLTNHVIGNVIGSWS